MSDLADEPASLPGFLTARRRRAVRLMLAADDPIPPLPDPIVPRPAGWRSAGARRGLDPAFSLGTRRPAGR